MIFILNPCTSVSFPLYCLFPRMETISAGFPLRFQVAFLLLLIILNPHGNNSCPKFLLIILFSMRTSHVCISQNTVRKASSLFSLSLPFSLPVLGYWDYQHLLSVKGSRRLVYVRCWGLP